MRSCVYCKTRYEKDSGVTFHKFPFNYTIKLWLKNMKRVNWTPKTSDYLCSKHFTVDCFVKHPSRTTLKKCSIPTIFIENDSSFIAAQTDMSTDDNQRSQDSEIDWATSNSPVVPMHIELPNNECLSSQMNPIGTLSCHIPATHITTTVPSSSYDTSQPSTSYKTSHTSTPKRSNAKICANIKLDHRYENTPKSSKSEFERVRRALKMSQTRVKVLSQHVKRLKIRVSTLKTVIAELKKITCL